MEVKKSASSTETPRVVTPAGPDETAELFREAVAAGWRLRPTGAEVGLDIGPGGGGLSPRADVEPHVLVSSRRLTGIVDYEPADLTLTARAGTTLGELDAELAGHGQWLPLDPPGGRRVTLGGAVAMGTAGPLAAAYGRPRDLVLGLTLVDGSSRHLKLGGRVVKNVAGFDLVRLVAGSRGGLGMIHEVSLRLYPRPQTDRTLVWPMEDRVRAARVGRRLAGLPLSLAALELEEGSRAEDGTGVPRLLLRLADRTVVVDRVESEARKVAGEPGSRLEGEDSRTAAAERSRTEGVGRPFVRVRVLPGRLPELVERLDELGWPFGPAVGVAGREGGELPPARDVYMAADLIRGTLRLWGGGLREGFSEGLEGLWGAAELLHGSLRILRVPRNGGRRGDSEGQDSRAMPMSPPAPAVARLHRELRLGFDPHGILPGAWREGWK